MGGRWRWPSRKPSSTVPRLVLDAATSKTDDLNFDERKSLLANGAKTILEEALHISKDNLSKDPDRRYWFLDPINNRWFFDFELSARDTWTKIPWDIFNRYNPETGIYGDKDRIVSNYEQWEDVLFSGGKVQTEEAAKIANDLYEEQLEEEMGWYEKGDNNKKEKKAVKTELKQQKKTPRFTSKDMPSEPLIYIREDYRVWQKAYNNAIAADEESPTQKANAEHVEMLQKEI